MRERFEAFALTLHPDKTRLIEFGRHVAGRRASVVSVDRRPSTSWVSRTSGGDHAEGASSFSGDPSDRMWATLREIKIELRDECISRSESRGHGYVHQSQTSPIRASGC